MKIGDLVRHNGNGYGFEGTAIILEVELRNAFARGQLRPWGRGDTNVYVLHDNGRTEMWGNWELEVIE